MADQTVRTIYEAVVSRAQRNLVDLSRDTGRAADSADRLGESLDKAGSSTISPKVDLADAEKAVVDMQKRLDDLEKSAPAVEIEARVDQAQRAVEVLQAEVDAVSAAPTVVGFDADITKAQRKREQLQRDLEVLSRMDPSPTVTADITRAEMALEDVDERLDALNSARAEAVATVTADTAEAQSALDDAQQRLDQLDAERTTLEVTADIGQAQSDLAAAEADLRALQGAEAEMAVTVDAEQLDRSFDDMGDAADEAGDDAGAKAGRSFLAGLNSTPVVGAVAGLVAAVGGVIAAGIIGETLDAIRNEDTLGAAMGLDEQAARKVGVAAGAAYSNAWGESVEANLGTAQSALENALIGDGATGREMQNIIEQLTAVSEILDVDVSEAAEAAGSMMKNGLAANAEEAFDIIIRGQQEGLNRSDDWIDTLREYGALFESIGLSGAEAGGLIEQAMDAGARNSDVAADALKEFSIRAQDDSKATRQAFKDIGLDADDMGAKIAKGGDDAKEGLDQVLDGLRDIEDPMARNAAGVALFGTMWEDMGNGAGVLAMDLDKLGNSWVDVGDTAESAMQRMQDNTATELEKTKRSVETAMTTVLGGLASAVEEPLSELSTYVTENRAEVLGFFIDLGRSLFDAAWAATEFGATTIEVLGDAAGGLDGIVRGAGQAVEALGHLTGDADLVALGENIQSSADGMQEFADASDGMADTLRDNVGGALDDAERKFEDWAGPALAQAELDDAVTAMLGRLDEFSAAVDQAGGTVTINGDTLTAEEAMNALIAEVDQSDGTVTINGESVPANDALNTLMRQINTTDGTITIKGNKAPAENAATQAADHADRTRGTIKVDAATGQAETDINRTARNRYSRITVTVGYSDPGFQGGGGSGGFANGGRIPTGLARGGTVGRGYGTVPAPYPGPGVDNVLWPLAAGGRTLAQPLAGDEWVINPVSSRQHDSVLRAINDGATRTELATLLGARSTPGAPSVTNHFHEVGGEAAEISATRVLNRVVGSLRGA